MMRLKALIIKLFLQKSSINYIWQCSKYASALLQKIFYIYNISRVKYLNLELLNRIFSLLTTIKVYFVLSFSIWVCFYRVVMGRFHGIFPFVNMLPLLNQGLGHMVFLLITGFPIVTLFLIVKSPWKFFEMLQGSLQQNLKMLLGQHIGQTSGSSLKCPESGSNYRRNEITLEPKIDIYVKRGPSTKHKKKYDNFQISRR